MRELSGNPAILIALALSKPVKQGDLGNVFMPNEAYFRSCAKINRMAELSGHVESAKTASQMMDQRLECVPDLKEDPLWLSIRESLELAIQIGEQRLMEMALDIHRGYKYAYAEAAQ